MNAKKIILSVAAIAAGALLTAQTVTFHGYMDYTNFALGQQFSQASADADWTHTEAAAEFGSFYNGRTELNMNVSAANFLFNIGVRLDASGNTWYNLYHDVTQTVDSDGDGTVDSYATTPFYQSNMRVGFLNDQMFVYTGKFEEWNAGYIFNGYALGGQPIQNLADRDAGQHFTGIEFAPYALSGFKAIVGVPILPIAGNGVQDVASNEWKNLYKKAKFAFSYNILRAAMTIQGGWRPGTYFTGVYKYDTADGATTNYFGEAYLQADMPHLIPGVPLNATLDVRYRNNETVDKETFAYFFGVSGQIKPVSNIVINFENRVAYADDHYIAVNEKLVYDMIGANVAYSIVGKPYVIGMQLNGMYAQDANGSVFSSGRMSCAWLDYSMSSDWMDCAASPASGAPGRYISVYGYPYFQKNFGNGYFRAGVEVQYSHFSTTNTTQSLIYRIPCAMCFWF